MDRDKQNSNTEGKDSSPKAKEAFDEWFESFDDSTGFLDSLSFTERQEHRNNLFQRVRHQLDLKKEENDQTEHPFFQPLLNPAGKTQIARIAAAVTIGVLLSIAGWYLDKKFGASEQITVIRKTNKVGELSKLTLPDSTTVWLGVASTLQYPQQFTGSQRHVELDGEAYFEVIHNISLPFIVTSGPVRTRVLGTAFNVKAYKEEQEIAVTLATGRIEVTSKKEATPMVLSPNEQLIFDKKSGARKIRKVDASVSSAWKNKELVFVRESFAKIAKTFERWYGVKFIFKDPALKKEIFVYHFKEFSLGRSMEILSTLTDFSYKIKDKKVIVSKK